LRTLLDVQDDTLEVSERTNKIGEEVQRLKTAQNAYKINYDILKIFVINNKDKLFEILSSTDMQIEKRELYKKVLEEVARLGSPGAGAGASASASAGDGDGAGDEGAPPPSARALPPTPSRPPGSGMGDAAGDADDVIENTTIDGAKVYKITNRRCPKDTEEGNPQYFTCDYVTEGQEITPAARCKLCYNSKRDHIQQGQGGGSRRRRRNTRLRKNKTRRNGKCRACRCPGGCKRSTCPCYRGRSKPCCTKRCRSRGRVCRC